MFPHGHSWTVFTKNTLSWEKWDGDCPNEEAPISEILSNDSYTALTTAPVVALDLETNNLDPREGNIVLVTLSTPEDACIFSPRQAEVFLPILKDMDRTFLMQGAPFDLGFIYATWQLPILGRVLDTRLLAKMVHPDLNPSLEHTIPALLGEPRHKELAGSFLTVTPDTAFTGEQLQYAAEDALCLFPLAWSLLVSLSSGSNLVANDQIVQMYNYIDGNAPYPLWR